MGNAYFSCIGAIIGAVLILTVGPTYTNGYFGPVPGGLNDKTVVFDAMILLMGGAASGFMSSTLHTAVCKVFRKRQD